MNIIEIVPHRLTSKDSVDSLSDSAFVHGRFAWHWDVEALATIPPLFKQLGQKATALAYGSAKLL